MPVDSTLAQRISLVGQRLSEQFVGKDEIIRLLLVAAIAGEHVLLVGEPGTAKSGLIRSLAKHLEGRYFEYLLTRFTEPNEIFGPVDINAFRLGVYKRRTEGMLSEAEFVFLDEVFKANSAILNALVSLLNERTITMGGEVIRCPLLSVFAASNTVPQDDALGAVFDRFLLRIRSENVEAYHFSDLVACGVRSSSPGGREFLDEAPLVRSDELRELGMGIFDHVRVPEALLATYKSMVLQLRSEGISFSDRRVVRSIRLFAASAFLDGRIEADASDLRVLRHVWNTADQESILEGIVQPVVAAHFAQYPHRLPVGAVGSGIEALEAEVERCRDLLTGEGTLSDMQLFSQLKALGEVKTALASMEGERAKALGERVTRLLEASLRTGRFAEL